MIIRQREIILLIYGLCIEALLLFACSRDPLSGTISEENTGTVQGLVRYENLEPAQNIAVSINNISVTNENSPITVSTDLNGRFSVKQLQWGTYTAEVIQFYTGSLELFSLNATDTMSTIALSLQTLGSIHGKIDTSFLNIPESATVYIPEINRMAEISAEGDFVLNNIAAATYGLVVLAGSDTLWNASMEAIKVPVAAGKKTFIALPEKTILQDDSAALPKYPSLRCEALNSTTTTLSWHSAANVTDVRMLRYSTNNSPDTVRLSNTDTVFTDSSLVPQTEYRYTILMVDRFTEYCIRSPHYTVTTPATDNDNRTPVIALSSPARDTAILQGTPFTISAEASDSDESIREVILMVDSTVITTVTTAPYQIAMPDLEVSRYTIIAGAVDNANDTTWSSSVSLFVDTLLRGDVNSDGIISLIDAEYISQYYVDLPVSVFNTETADVSGDGTITMFDALIVAQLVKGFISIPPLYSTGNATEF